MFKTTEYVNSFKTPSRQITGKVDVMKTGLVVVKSYTPDTNLVSFSIEKTVPNGKVFGFAISQKLTVEVLGIDSEITKANFLVPTVGLANGESVELPYFFIDSIEINKVTKTTKIVAYDIINYKCSYAVLKYNTGNTNYMTDIVNWAEGQVPVSAITIDEDCVNLDVYLGNRINIASNESVHNVFAQAAEALGAICYVTSGTNIRFRRLNTTVTDTLTPEDYFNFTTGNVTKLVGIESTNGLNDDYYNGDTTLGDYNNEGVYKQVLFENGFISGIQGNIPTMVDNLVSALKGSTRQVYNLEWRGCPAYEIGDYIAIQEKDGTIKYVHYLAETLTYNGGLRAVSSWEESSGETYETKPTTVGQVMTQTYARVDKAAQEVVLMASKVDQNTNDVATLKVTTDEISASVSSLESAVETRLSDENLEILVNNRVSSVQTTTGFTFDANGLEITKTGGSTTTMITENGMTVNAARSGSPLLTANSSGVEARDLKATTYLFIGDVSRFENYVDENGTTRTACFMLG